MENAEIVNQIIEYVPTIDWSVSIDNEAVSVFETTIRYMGGLLAGYDLLSGPLNQLAVDVSSKQSTPSNSYTDRSTAEQGSNVA